MAGLQGALWTLRGAGGASSRQSVGGDARAEAERRAAALARRCGPLRALIPDRRGRRERRGRRRTPDEDGPRAGVLLRGERDFVDEAGGLCAGGRRRECGGSAAGRGASVSAALRARIGVHAGAREHDPGWWPDLGASRLIGHGRGRQHPSWRCSTAGGLVRCRGCGARRTRSYSARPNLLPGDHRCLTIPATEGGAMSTISAGTRQELVTAVADRYRQSTAAEKRLILDCSGTTASTRSRLTEVPARRGRGEGPVRLRAADRGLRSVGGVGPDVRHG